ncbi:tRNA glutamyl-Q(34) synthetase GluQRS [Paraburkholderia solisilvae]|uniref:Glutamyl-Q tRNA(Asp) synthetase n=1 Tax=Paraburkholderia solisilvae TaxID=624376 RepID=A0A6J5D3B0_9BURK|nr:tRNA glutamyl-Q(34) synthetase GluQRS [Paraburkholderia solisilvae]CAB3748779.1 Glutamyl-Q tRNA(Asp) synthetase [Paraburkholderia solisilvae]
MTYRGRFAPSPTGPLHIGSLVSALASWLDARAHHGRWLVRIDDIDGPRTVPGAADDILATLERFGMRADEPPVWQSRRTARYEQAFAQLQATGLVYPCGCTRKEIADSLVHAHVRHTTLAYPGTCRNGLHGKTPRAWRLRVPDSAAESATPAANGAAIQPARGTANHAAAGSAAAVAAATAATADPVATDDASIIRFDDRWQGPQSQNLATEVGDFVLYRADGQWAYQLAAVVDDADADITHIVRGADLLDSTARQIYLQRCLGVPTPSYLHVPVVVNQAGEKLSKQTGAQALDASRPLDALYAAARHLGLAMPRDGAPTSLDAFHAAATTAWAQRIDALHVR